MSNANTAVAENFNEVAASTTASTGKKNKWIVPAIVAVALAAVSYFVVQSYLYEGTDDAYVQAHSLMLAPRVGGTVTKVFVKENEHVKAGQVLVQLDDQDYSTVYNQAVADMASVQADLIQATADYHRISRLYHSAAVSRQDLDAAKAKYENLTSRLKADQFKSDQAKLNMSYTQLVAPEDGIIAKKSVEPGMVIPAGQSLFGFVSSSERWVEANFKETQLSSVKPGQKVDVTVDAIDGRTFQGTVDSKGAATGATFTLLPPDNATGNFTKVVQRIPVKIVLNNLSPADVDDLAAGLSAVVSVKVH